SAFISPLKQDRDAIKEVIGKENFIEVFIDTPLHVCEERDVKGLYKKARNGEISNFTGLTAPYEKPENPDIIIKTENSNIEECAQKVVQYLMNTIKIKEL